ARAQALGEKVRGHAGAEEAVAAFYRQLPLAAMCCSLDPAHVARRHCEECGLAFCRLCDAVVHEDPRRATHRRPLFRHVGWDVSGSPSLMERLERALAIDQPLTAASPLQEAASATPGVVLRDGSAAARLHGRFAPASVDGATRARVLERFASAMRRWPAACP